MVTQITLGTYGVQDGKNVLTGGASQIDTKGLIDGLATAKRAPAVRLETANKLIDKQTTALNKLKTLLAAVQTAADTLRNPSGVDNASKNIFQYRTATLSNNTGTSSNYATVAVQPGATVQTHTIDSVTSLAQASKSQSANLALADSTTASAVSATGSLFKPGTVNFKNINGGTAVGVTLNEGDSLQTAVNKFNAVSSQTGIQYGILNVAPGQYKLTTTITKTGTAAAAATGVSSDPSGVMTQVAFTTTQTATDAVFKIDGVAVTRSTNVISDVLDNVTLTLKQTFSGTDTNGKLLMDIQPDTTLVANAITQLADSYNAFRLFASGQSQLDDNSAPKDTSVLYNDPTMRNLIADVSNEVTRIIQGITGTTTTTTTGGGGTGAVTTTTAPDGPSGYSLTSTAGSNPNSYLGVTVDQFAPASVHTINSINQLATNTVQVSAGFGTGFANDGTRVATGGLFRAGTVQLRNLSGGTVSLTIAVGDKYNTVVSKINALTAQTGIHAAIDQNPIDFSEITFTSTATGAASGFDLTSSSTVVSDPSGVFANLGATTQQVAVDASYQLDGVTKTSASNTITTAIPGVTLNLLAPDPHPITLTVTGPTSNKPTTGNIIASNGTGASIYADFASIDPNAPAGTHTLSNFTIAASGITRSAGLPTNIPTDLATNDGVFHAGTVQLKTVTGGTVALTVTNSDTYNNVIDKFNAISSQTGFTASYSNFGGTAYIYFNSNTSGSGTNDTSLKPSSISSDPSGVLTNVGETTYITGTNATYTLDGVVKTNPSNYITDIPGVALNLVNSNPSVTLTVTTTQGAPTINTTTTTSGGSTTALTTSDGTTASNYVVNLTTDATAAAGTHVLSNVSLGQREVQATTINNNVRSATDIAVSGSGYTPMFQAVNVTLNTLTGGTVALNVASGSTYQQFLDQFNALTSQTGITASLNLNGGVGGSIVFTGQYGQTFDMDGLGAAPQIVATDPTNQFNVVSITTQQSATAGSYTLDGVVHAYNGGRITDIPGVSFDLNASKPTGTITFTTTAGTGTGGGTTTTTTTPGLSQLADIGLTLDNFAGDDTNPATKNILTVDTDKLNSILASNFDGVAKLFEYQQTSNNSSFATFKTSNLLSVNAFTVNLNIPDGTTRTASPLSATATYVDASGTSHTVAMDVTAISGGGYTINGKANTPFEGSQYVAGANVALGVAADTNGNYKVAINVNVTQGYADRFYNLMDTYNNTTNGSVTTDISTLADTKKRKTDEITAIDDKIATYRAQLVQQYATLESSITKANNILQLLDAQTKAKNSSG